MQQAQQLPQPCRKVFIDQICKSRRLGKNLGLSSKAEEFTFVTGPLKFSFTNVWIQGTITDVVSVSGNRKVVICDDTSQANVYGIDRIIRKNPFLASSLTKGTYVMVTGKVLQADAKTVNIQATRVAEIPASFRDCWKSDVEVLQGRISK